MRDYKREAKVRATWIAQTLTKSGLDGVVFGSSGGKDSALVGILCKIACTNTLGVIMPCGGHASDVSDALLLGKKFDIEHIVVDVTATRDSLVQAIGSGDMNIAPRLRMATLYTIAATRNSLVAGTSNRSEIYLGYTTKWGDAACDFNPIADLTATEVMEFLKALGAPEIFYTKSPSAGFYEGQTDEDELGFSYNELDNFLLHGVIGDNINLIQSRHEATKHKRNGVLIYEPAPNKHHQ